MRRRKSEQAVEIESSPPPSVSEAYVRQEFKESDQALMKDPADHGALQRILRLARGIRENKLIELACRVHAVARNYCERVTSRMQSSVIDQLEQAVATLRDCCASETMSAAMFAQCRDRVSPRWMDGLSISQNKP